MIDPRSGMGVSMARSARGPGDFRPSRQVRYRTGAAVGGYRFELQTVDEILAEMEAVKNARHSRP